MRWLARLLKRLLKLLGWSLVTLALVLGAALLFLRHPVGREWLRAQAHTRLASIVPGLRIGRIEGDFLRWIALRKIVLQDRFENPVASLGELRLEFDLWALWKRRIVVKELLLREPRVEIRALRDGSLNLAHVLKPQPPGPRAQPGESKPLPRLALRVGSVRILGGALSYAAAPGEPLRVADFKLDMGAKLRSDGQGLVAGSLTLAALGGRLKLPGQPEIVLSLRSSVQLFSGTRGKAVVRASTGGAFDLFAHRIAGELAVAAQQSKRKLALQLDLKGGLERLVAGLRVALPGGGSVVGQGWVALPGGADAAADPRYALASLRVQGLNPRALHGRFPEGKLSLAFKAQGHGSPLAPGSAHQLELCLDPSRLAGQAIERLVLRLDAKGAKWRLAELNANAAGATLSLAGSGEARAGSLRLALHAADLSRLRVVPSLPRLGGALRLRAALRGEAGVWVGGTVAGSAERVVVDQLALAKAEIDLKLPRLGLGSLQPAALLRALRAKLAVKLEGLRSGDKALVTRASLSAEGGSTRLRLGIEARGPQFDAQLSTVARRRGSDVLLQLESLAVRAQGQRIRLLEPAKLSLRAGGLARLAPSRWALLGGELRLEGLFAPGRREWLDGRLALSGLRIPRLGRLSGHAAAHGDRRALAAKLRLVLADQPLDLDLLLALRGRGRKVPALDRKGRLRARLNLPRVDLATFAAFFPTGVQAGGQASLSADISGTLAAPLAQVKGALRGGRYGDKLREVNAELALDAQQALVSLQAHAGLASRQILALTLSSTTSLGALLTLARQPSRLARLPAKLALRIAELPWQPLRAWLPRSPTLAGRVHGELRGQGTFGALELELSAAGQGLVVDGHRLADVALSGALSAGTGESRLRLSVALDRRPLLVGKAAFGAGLPALVAARGLPPHLPLSGQLEILPHSLASLTQPWRELRAFGGRIAGRLQASGTLARPTARFRGELKQLRRDKAALGDLAIGADLDANKRASVRIALKQPGGGELRATGSLTVPTMHAEAGLRLKALALAPLRVLAPQQLKAFEGALSGELRAAGPVKTLRPVGRLSLSAGRVRWVGLPALSKVQCELSLSGEKIVLKRLHLESGGSLDISGEVLLDKSLTSATLALDAKTAGLRVSAGAVHGAVLNGPLRVRGTLSPQALRLGVALPGTRLKIPEFNGDKDLHGTALPAEVVFVDGTAGGSREAASSAPGARPLGGDAQGVSAARAARTVQIRLQTTPLVVYGKEADVEVRSDLHVQLGTDGAPRVRGRVELRRGWIQLMKFRYRVEEGTVLFSGEPVPNPDLNLQLSHRFADVTVFVGVRGSAKSPRLELRSEPPVYDRSQILSLIVTGRTTPVGGGAETDKGMAVASAVAQMLLAPLLDKAAQKVGIDVATVNVETKTSEGASQVRARGELGKFLTDRLYIGYRPLIGVAEPDENSHEGLFEYRISPRWMLSGTYGDAGIGGLDLFWIFRY